VRTELIFGPPGCGKTYTMIEKVREALRRGVSPDRIGFFSYTNKSVDEGLARLLREFNLTRKDLPFVRTLHGLAFNGLGLQRSDVMGTEDYISLGRILGLNFSGGTTIRPDGDWILPGDAFHDDYLRIADRAELRMLPLEEEFRQTATYGMSYSALTQIVGTLENYKRANHKLSFTDMLLQYIEIGEPPYLELLIIDEAQDLVPLQWAVVRKLMTRAKEVYFVGDDDQAIHAWAGVDIQLFLNASENKTVLTQSYRLPRAVFNIANRTVRRIDVRQPKVWYPTEREGLVQFHMDRYTVPLDQGSWTVMARTNYQVSELANTMREDGYFFSRGGQRSVSMELAVALDGWARLGKGETLSKDQVKALFKRLPKSGRKQALKSGAMSAIETGDPEGRYSMDLLVNDYGLLVNQGDIDVFDLSFDDTIYIRSLQRRGTDLLAEPQIKLSTIHAMKGGEDKKIMLLTDSTKNCATSADQDNEHRVFYTGETRAMEELHIVESSKKYRYLI
jgi:superfamily I DNA/RNA helicase